MRWPWERPPVKPNRATLTICVDGMIVMGFPPDLDTETRDLAMRDLQTWVAASEPKPHMAFPFPVDVFDRRPVTPTPRLRPVR